MAGEKISALNSVVTPALTDIFPSVQSDNVDIETTKETLQQILDLFKQQIAFQPNNDVDSWDYDTDGTNCILSNPAPTLLILNNSGAFVAQLVRLPDMTEATAWKKGTVVPTFFNNTANGVQVTNLGGSVLYTIPAGGVVQVDVVSGSTMNGSFLFNAPLQAYKDLSDLSSPSAARTNLGLGTAATKAVSNTGVSIVAGVTGTPAGNSIPQFTGDEDGTLYSSGFSVINFLQTSEDLSDLQAPIKGRNTIKAMANGGYIQPTITTETLVLTNPAPTYIELSNFNGDPGVGIQLPPPYDVDSVDGFDDGNKITFDNVLGNFAVPIYQYNDSETPILELVVGGYYVMVVKNSAGDVAFRRLV